MTREYASAHARLGKLVGELQELVNAVTRKAMPAIMDAVEKASVKEGLLKELVEQGGREGLFIRPRTIVFHGVKVGMEKGKGKIDFDDEETVIRLIRKHLPEQAELLINMKETVSKTALKGVEVADLRRIGCTVEETGDQVVIRPMDNEVRKAVKALLKANAEEAAGQ